MRPRAARLTLVAALVLAGPAGAASPKNPFTLKGGEQLIFSVDIADGKVTLGTPRLVKLGAAEPKDGEISVGLTPRDKELYSQIVVTERTSKPIAFVATGHIGEVVIDEREVEGKLGATYQQHIGGVSWTVVLHDFTLQPPPPDEKPPELKPSE